MKNNNKNRSLLHISLFILFFVLFAITPAFSAPPEWYITPPIKDFDNVNVDNVSEVEEFTYTNHSLDTATLDTVELTGTNANEFSIVEDNCSNIPGGQLDSGLDCQKAP